MATDQRPPLPRHVFIQRRIATASQTWQFRVVGPDSRSRGYVWSPPTDVFETDDGGVVRVEIAGVRPDELDITFRQGEVVIAGQRRDPESAPGEWPRRTCALKEIATGPFRVLVHIPWPVDEVGIEATYRDGFLTVRLPRLQTSG